MNTKEYQAKYQARYRASSKGKAAHARADAKYQATAKGRVAAARYSASSKRKASYAKYAASDKGVLRQKRSEAKRPPRGQRAPEELLIDKRPDGIRPMEGEIFVAAPSLLDVRVSVARRGIFLTKKERSYHGEIAQQSMGARRAAP